MTLQYTTFFLATVGLYFAWKLTHSYRKQKEGHEGLPLPPGPKGYPFLDNLFDFPSDKPWLVYDKWTKTYGDIIYFKVLGQPFLVLGSFDKTYDIFEKRSSNYSSRASLPMLNEMMGWTWSFALMPYGQWWRRHRRIFHDFFHPNVVHRYHSVHLDTSREFLRRVLESPDKFMQHIRYSFASTILKICYGITIRDDNDPLLSIAETALASLAEAGNPGAFLVDLFPAMKYIPEWFPGAGWKKKANYWRHISHLLLNKPWEITQEQVGDGSAPVSMAASLMEKLSNEDSLNRAEQEQIFRDACAIALAGGSDTTVSTVQSLFMAMCLYPDVQAKAQAELDHVLHGRLPEFNDRQNLPYINAIVKESLRWQPVTPLAVPHMASEADEYEGYYIPKGTIVIGNSWSILHDPEVYPEPLRYNPDRFLKDGKIDPSVRDPDSAAFGFGRRICPGRFLGNDSLFILVAHILAVYNIRPGLDEDGKEVEILPEMTSGLLSYPQDFTCRITPRSSKAEGLIRNSDLMN